MEIPDKAASSPNQFLDDEHHQAEAVFALYDTVNSGVDLPVAAQRYFERNPSELHKALDELLERYPQRVILLFAERLKLSYPLDESA